MTILESSSGERYKITIGLEIHAQIKSKQKLFSKSQCQFGAEQNQNTSLIDAAMPGMMPVLNMFCVRQAVKTGFGIKGTINKYSVFDRKQYFYPDLPQGYQITQMYHPIVENGEMEVDLEDGSKKTIRIERIHIEQDAGKLVHDRHPEKSSIDLNRSGIALMEIVSKPDINSAHEASEYVKKLRTLLKELETSDADMEKGSFRCDVNISIAKENAKELGVRSEIKNLNSIKSIRDAIEYESHRHLEAIENGEKLTQDTRLFDTVRGVTNKMRDKETAHDYRYFPDPDLLPVRLTDEYIEEIKKNLPELPDDRKKRYINELGLSDYDAGVISNDRDGAKYFDFLVKEGNKPQVASNWLTVELFGRLNKASISLGECKVKPEYLSSIVKMIESGEISGKMAKDLLDEVFETGIDPKKIAEEKGMKQISDSSTIVEIAKKVVEANQDKVEQYKAGKDRLFGFFVGQVMKESRGQANPKMASDILKEIIG